MISWFWLRLKIYVLLFPQLDLPITPQRLSSQLCRFNLKALDSWHYYKQAHILVQEYQ